MKTEMPITATIVKKAPNYRKTARELLASCRAFYEDPENEKAFQEWKERQKHGNRKV